MEQRFLDNQRIQADTQLIDDTTAKIVLFIMLEIHSKFLNKLPLGLPLSH